MSRPTAAHVADLRDKAAKAIGPESWVTALRDALREIDALTADLKRAERAPTVSRDAGGDALGIEGRSYALGRSLKVTGLAPQHYALIDAALRDVALAAGEAVQAAHQHPTAAGDCPRCEAEGTVLDGNDLEECGACEGTGIADAAIILGIERRAER